MTTVTSKRAAGNFLSPKWADFIGFFLKIGASGALKLVSVCEQAPVKPSAERPTESVNSRSAISVVGPGSVFVGQQLWEEARPLRFLCRRLIIGVEIGKPRRHEPPTC